MTMQLLPRKTDATLDVICIVALLLAAIVAVLNAYAPVINGWLQ